GREEGERNRQHGVSGFDTRRDERQSHRVRSTGHSNAKARLAVFRVIALEVLDHGAADETGGVERGLEDRAQLFTELTVNGDEIEKGNLVRNHLMPPFDWPTWKTDA